MILIEQYQDNLADFSRWCRGCDSAKVPDGSKCKVCGIKTKPKRNKK